MDSIEVPQYFICPISLQIMQDPVIAITGITYDRASIERWFFVDNNTTCPVSNQPLPRDSDLTPNHTLRRLIQAWCTVNAVDRIPTPRAPVDKIIALKLVDDLAVSHLQLTTLKLISVLASDNESNRRSMMQAGIADCLISLIISCTRKSQPDRVEEALDAIQSLRVSPDDLKPLVADNNDLVESLTWVLQHGSSNNQNMRCAASLTLKSIFDVASQSLLEKLKPNFFEAVIHVVHDGISQKVTRAALQVLLHACSLHRNRTKIVEAGAVAELIDLELTVPDKRTTELVLGVLDHLSTCADGRAELVRHAAGIAVVSKRILKVSPLVDDRAVRILSSICQYSATNEVLQEMLGMGAVSKLCFVLQADCSSDVRERVRWVLRLHSRVWKNSPCVHASLLSRYP